LLILGIAVLLVVAETGGGEAMTLLTGFELILVDVVVVGDADLENLLNGVSIVF